MFQAEGNSNYVSFMKSNRANNWLIITECTHMNTDTTFLRSHEAYKSFNWRGEAYLFDMI